MRRKWRSESGLTLVELLAAVVILILLGLLLNTGLQMAVSSYRAITAQSEVELLLATAVDALANDLRCARDVVEQGNGGFTYTSDSFGENTSLTLEEGQIEANGKRLLPTGAYGSGEAYRVAEMTITPAAPDESDGVIFTIKLNVETVDGAISASTPGGGVAVRCLNPKKEDT